MSGVVLRCAHCGTTQSSPGECEACHEGQVRYYCTNHSPGRWLDGHVCSECGAAYGRPARRPAAPPIPPPPPASRPPPRRDTSATPVPSGHRADPWGEKSPETTPRERDYAAEEAIARARALKRLHDLLGGTYARRRTADDIRTPGYSVAPVIAGGCLRFVLLVFLFLLLSFFGLSMMGSWLMFGF
jgi:hypothetical protein